MFQSLIVALLEMLINFKGTSDEEIRLIFTLQTFLMIGWMNPTLC